MKVVKATTNGSSRADFDENYIHSNGNMQNAESNLKGIFAIMVPVGPFQFCIFHPSTLFSTSSQPVSDFSRDLINNAATVNCILNSYVAIEMHDGLTARSRLTCHNPIKLISCTTSQPHPHTIHGKIRFTWTRASVKSIFIAISSRVYMSG